VIRSIGSAERKKAEQMPRIEPIDDRTDATEILPDPAPIDGNSLLVPEIVLGIRSWVRLQPSDVRRVFEKLVDGISKPQEIAAATGLTVRAVNNALRRMRRWTGSRLGGSSP
jgi:DNA-directed RNA polymerase specialized sigma24 family protein